MSEELFNELDVRKQFLNIYGEEPNDIQLEYIKQLEYINSLIEKNDYKQINKIIEEYKQSTSNNDLVLLIDNNNDNLDVKKLILCDILILIFEYKREENQYKKKFLEDRIQYSIEKYNTPKEEILSMDRIRKKYALFV